MYFIQKNLNRFYQLGYTYFLNPSELKQVCSHLKKNEYFIYSPYPDCEKKILYKKKKPNVLLYEIHIKVFVRHQDILGCMYSLNIASDLFGDVVIDEGHYYIFILPIVQNYFETNFLKVRNSSVTVEEVALSVLENYERKFIEEEYIVSSCRIDTILSSILHVSRGSISEYLKRKDILLNYEVLKNSSILLKEGDTFSIRGVGKYMFSGVLNITKGKHYVILIRKYS